MRHVSPQHAGSIVRRLATDDEVDIDWDGHALKRMGKRGITKQDVRAVLCKGKVTKIEPHITGEDRWTVQGSDLDERTLDVVVEVFEEAVVIYVVTVFEAN